MKITRALSALEPPARAACQKFLHICVDVIGIDVRIHETLRSKERQAELYKGGKATKVKLGWHNYGLAWDFGCYKNGQYLHNDSTGLYTKCGHIAQALDCVWGGNWRMRDYGHCEYHPGFTLKQYIASLDEKKK